MEEPAFAMDLGRAILWSSVALAGSGIAGYVFGFREAQPTINTLAIVGAVALALAAITLAATVLAYLRSRSLNVSLNRLSVGARIGLVWSGVAILVVVNIGAFIGFTIGIRTAQSVTDILPGVGIVAAAVASATMLIGVMYARRSRCRMGGHH